MDISFTIVVVVLLLVFVIATAIGFVGFGEWPDVWVFVGAGIIIAATLYITRREARLARQGASTAPITGATAVPGKAV